MRRRRYAVVSRSQKNDFDVLSFRFTIKATRSLSVLDYRPPVQFTGSPSAACKLISSFTSCTKVILHSISWFGISQSEHK